jgi:predicted regulator of Ras-like GTPase activity (Roadblock/LC7/MglB family)
MKLFNLVKGFFGRGAAEPAPVENFADEAPSAELENHAEVMPSARTTSNSYATNFAATQADPTSTASVDVQNSEILLPLSSLVAALPVELQQRVLMDRVGEVSIAFPLQKVLAQLSQGLVRVAFGEIRQAEPVAFSGGADRDYMMVTLPLAELVNRLGPALLPVKSRKPVEIPAEITSPFGLRGEGLAISKTPGKSTTPGTSFTTRPRGAQPVAPVPPPVADPRARGNVTSIPKPAAPGALPGTSFYNRTAPPAPPAPERPVAPSNGASLPPGKPPVSKPPVGNVPMGGFSLPFTPAPEKVAKSPTSNGNGNGSHASTSTNPISAAAPASPFVIAFSVIEESLPQELRLEAAQMELADAKIFLPIDQVAEGVKRGRIAFTWKQLRAWILPAVPAAVSAHDGLTVILPLAVIAPIFMTRHKQATATQKRVIVDQKIPNLFFGFPQPEAPAPAAPEVAASPIPVVPAPKPADTNYFVFDDDSEDPLAGAAAPPVAKPVKPAPTPGTTFASRKATPNEVVTKASLLEGVYGALVVLPDGLLVAAKLDPALNGETVAALIPQMYSKLSGCTKELRMGELNNLNFTVGKVPWKIFRVNGIFFAAFGCPGESLPTGHLAELAAELDYKKTQ